MMKSRKQLESRAKKRKQTERNLPDTLDILVPESRLYTQLLKFEQRLDATIARKWVDVQVADRAPTPNKKILRLFIFNDFHHQTPTTEDYNGAPVSTPFAMGAPPPSWTLTIQGQILDPISLSAVKKPELAFSNFVSSITVQLDPKQYPGVSGFIEWRKGTAVGLTDGFEIKRKGNSDVPCKISIYREYSPPRYKLSKFIGRLLGVNTDTEPASMPQILTALWEYIKIHKLQVPSDPTKINFADSDMIKVFGDEPVAVFSLKQVLRTHMSNPDPIVFDYTIKVELPEDEEGQVLAEKQVDSYDIPVECPELPNPSLVGQPPSIQKESTREQEIYSIVNRIHVHNRKREFLTTFSEAPVDVINMILAAQAAEMASMPTLETTNQASRDTTAEDDARRRASFYQQEWVPDAVDRYLRTRDTNKNKKRKDSLSHRTGTRSSLRQQELASKK